MTSEMTLERILQDIETSPTVVYDICDLTEFFELPSPLEPLVLFLAKQVVLPTSLASDYHLLGLIWGQSGWHYPTIAYSNMVKDVFYCTVHN